MRAVFDSWKDTPKLRIGFSLRQRRYLVAPKEVGYSSFIINTNNICQCEL